MLRETDEYRELVDAAREGSARAQNFLGAYLASGSKDADAQTEAMYWYAQAICRGSTDAKWNAGTMLLFGEGVDRPYIDLGIRLIRSAAAAGNATACSFLAHAHRKGNWGLGVDLGAAENYESIAINAINTDEISEKIDLWSLGVPIGS